MEQMVKTHNKKKKQKQKLDRKRKGFSKKFNRKYFIYNKTGHLTKDCRNRA